MGIGTSANHFLLKKKQVKKKQVNYKGGSIKIHVWFVFYVERQRELRSEKIEKGEFEDLRQEGDES